MLEFVAIGQICPIGRPPSRTVIRSRATNLGPRYGRPVTAPNRDTVLQFGIQQALRDGWRVESTGPGFAVLAFGDLRRDEVRPGGHGAVERWPRLIERARVRSERQRRWGHTARAAA